MEASFNFADYKRLTAMVKETGDVKVAEPYLLAFMTPQSGKSLLRIPCRFDCYMGILCTSGRVRIEVNLQEYEITANTLFFYFPDTLIRIIEDNNKPCDETTRFVLVACSTRLIESIKINIDAAVNLVANPCIKVGDNELKVLQGYYQVASALAESRLPDSQFAVPDIGSSLFTFIAALVNDNASALSRGLGSVSKSKIIFEKFLNLVAKHHTQERSVSFYAEQMDFTPKYLSQLIRKVSGKSAPEWIDSFVILEAKNMLKYSGMSVKDIAYNLNFNSLPVFYKFFKTHTGMTPKEFQKG